MMYFQFQISMGTHFVKLMPLLLVREKCLDPTSHLVFVLANFYCICVPNMKYEIISSLVDLPGNSPYWLCDVHNSLNLITTTATTEHENKCIKRKLEAEAEDQENEIQMETVTNK